MKKLLILALITPIFSLAQDTLSKWSVGVNFSLDYSYRALHKNDSRISDSYIDFINEYEHPKIAYTTGINIQYHFNNKFSLASGVHYSQKNYGTQDYTYSVYDTLGNLTKYPASQTYRFKYLDIPLEFRHFIGNNRFKFFYGVGANLNILLESGYEFRFDYFGYYRNVNTTKDLRRINFSPTLAIGVKYDSHSNLSVLLEPIVRYQLLTNSTQAITERLYNVGLNLSLFYRL